MTGIGDIIGPLRVGSPAHGGACVARQEGMAVFIYGTLPGELVRAEVVETRSRLWFARAVEILEPSPYRVPHIWPLAARTGVGGADLGHVSLPMQLKWKADVITEQLRRIAHIEHKVKVEAAPLDTGRGGLGYRTRVDFVADDAGHLGMFIPWSNQIVPIDSMPLVDSKIAAVEPWRHVFEPGSRISLIHASGVPTLRPERVLAVKNGHEIVYSRQYLTGGRPVQAFDEARYGQKVYERVSVHGEDYDYRVDATGFWQAHQDAPKILLRTVLDTIGYIGTETVFDLYCGSGLFTGPIAAADAGQVWGVEGDFSAASNARYNTHRFKNVRILSGDVGRLLESDALPRRADVVVLDPPRVGAGRKVVDLIATRVPRRIVYVACDPAAMARDLGWIASLGYVLVKLRAFDLFPHTHHVECVAVLEMPQS